jgi:hypothetical protein
MKRYPMLFDWQNLYCKNGYITKSNLHVQRNPHQNFNDIHHREWKINPNVHMEAQKTINSQGNNEQKNQHCMYHITRLQTILQSCSNKNTLILSQWNRYKLQIWIHTTTSTWYLTKMPRTYNGEKHNLFNNCCWEN